MSSRTRSDFGTLGDRLQGGVSGGNTAAEVERLVVRHVWVNGSTPGLLVRWRRTTAGWCGQVCVVSGKTGEPVAEWFRADQIVPADAA